MEGLPGKVLAVNDIWFFFKLICVSVLPVCMNVPCACSAHQGQKRLLDSWELELQPFQASVTQPRSSPGAGSALNC